MAPVLLLIAMQAAPAPVEPEPVEIVVTAVRQKCRVSEATRVLSDAEFRRRASAWAAGVPVRVVAPASADMRCLSRIAFRLADHGVKRMIFVEPGERPGP